MKSRPAAVLLCLATAATALTACAPADPSTPTATTTQTTSATATQTTSATATHTTSATATTTATATRTATTSQGQAATNPSTAASSGAGDAALTQSYCLTTRRICFRYPAGYTVVKDPQPSDSLGNLHGEAGHVTAPDGTAILYFKLMKGAAHGGAEPNNAPQQLVLKANQTKAVADRYQPTQPIYATAVAVEDTGKGFFLREFVTSSANAATPGGTFTTGNLALGSSGVEYPEFKPEEMLRFSTARPDGSIPTYYPTRDEAAAQLNQPSAVVALQILSSLES